MDNIIWSCPSPSADASGNNNGTASDNNNDTSIKSSWEYGNLSTGDGITAMDPAAIPVCYSWVLLAIIPFLLSLLTIMGNLFVIIATLTNRSISRKQTSILILNLAIADLLVGVVVMPLAVTVMLTNGRWLFGKFMCRVWISLDVICSTASIFTLCLISVDRWIGVMYPLRYQAVITKDRLIFGAVLVWIGSLAILLSTIRYHPADLDSTICDVGDELRYVTHSVVCSFFLPLIVIIGVYSMIYHRTKKREMSLLQSLILESETSRSQNETSQPLLKVTGTQSDAPVGQRDRASILSAEHIRNERAYSNPETKTNKSRPKLNRLKASQPTPDNEEHTTTDSPDSANVKKRRGTIAAFAVPTLRIHYGGADNDRQKQRRFYQKHKKSAQTLALIVGAFVFCWLPFFLLYLIDNSCDGCVPKGALYFFTWIGYANSALNPIIYAVIVTAFREAFLHIVNRNLCNRNVHLYCCHDRRNSFEGQTDENGRICTLKSSGRNNNGDVRRKNGRDESISLFEDHSDSITTTTLKLNNQNHHENKRQQQNSRLQQSSWKVRLLRIPSLVRFILLNNNSTDADDNPPAISSDHQRPPYQQSSAQQLQKHHLTATTTQNELSTKQQQLTSAESTSSRNVSLVLQNNNNLTNTLLSHHHHHHYHQQENAGRGVSEKDSLLEVIENDCCSAAAPAVVVVEVPFIKVVNDHRHPNNHHPTMVQQVPFINSHRDHPIEDRINPITDQQEKEEEEVGDEDDDNKEDNDASLLKGNDKNRFRRQNENDENDSFIENHYQYHHVKQIVDEKENLTSTSTSSTSSSSADKMITNSPLMYCKLYRTLVSTKISQV